MRAHVRSLLIGVMLAATALAAGQTLEPNATPGCRYGTIFLGQTIDESWSPGDCNSGAPANRVYDYHLFSGAAGQQVTATLSFPNPALGPASIAIKSLDGAVLASGSGPSPISATETLPASGYYVVLVQSLSPLGYGDYSLGLAVAASAGGCTGLCLNGGRFQVTATWTKPDGTHGDATPALFTGDTGYFWFFDDSNIELVVKVLDGRAINGSFWIFAAGLTNIQVEITVVDTVTKGVKTYLNPQGQAFVPIQDTTPNFTPPPPPDANVQGTWDGTATLESGVQESLVFTLFQSGATVTGTLTLEGGLGAGTLTGNIQGRRFYFSVTETVPCAGSIGGSGTVDESGNQMSGGYMGSDCAGASAGNFTATRR